MYIMTCLTISKNASIIAFKRVIENIFADTFKYCFLTSEIFGTGIDGIETMIKCKTFGSFPEI